MGTAVRSSLESPEKGGTRVPSAIVVSEGSSKKGSSEKDETYASKTAAAELSSKKQRARPSQSSKKGGAKKQSAKSAKSKKGGAKKGQRKDATGSRRREMLPGPWLDLLRKRSTRPDWRAKMANQTTIVITRTAFTRAWDNWEMQRMILLRVFGIISTPTSACASRTEARQAQKFRRALDCWAEHDSGRLLFLFFKDGVEREYAEEIAAGFNATPAYTKGTVMHGFSKNSGASVVSRERDWADGLTNAERASMGIARLGVILKGIEPVDRREDALHMGIRDLGVIPVRIAKIPGSADMAVFLRSADDVEELLQFAEIDIGRSANVVVERMNDCGRRTRAQAPPKMCCFDCGKPGHFRGFKHCPGRRCRYCDKPGHLEKKCRARLAGIPPTCGHCGGTHTSNERHCPVACSTQGSRGAQRKKTGGKRPTKKPGAKGQSTAKQSPKKGSVRTAAASPSGRSLSLDESLYAIPIQSTANSVSGAGAATGTGVDLDMSEWDLDLTDDEAKAAHDEATSEHDDDSDDSSSFADTDSDASAEEAGTPTPGGPLFTDRLDADISALDDDARDKRKKAKKRGRQRKRRSRAEKKAAKKRKRQSMESGDSDDGQAPERRKDRRCNDESDNRVDADGNPLFDASNSKSLGDEVFGREHRHVGLIDGGLTTDPLQSTLGLAGDGTGLTARLPPPPLSQRGGTSLLEQQKALRRTTAQSAHPASAENAAEELSKVKKAASAGKITAQIQ
jgi:hypothetical protein